MWSPRPFEMAKIDHPTSMGTLRKDGYVPNCRTPEISSATWDIMRELDQPCCFLWTAVQPLSVDDSSGWGNASGCTHQCRHRRTGLQCGTGRGEDYNFKLRHSNLLSALVLGCFFFLSCSLHEYIYIVIAIIFADWSIGVVECCGNTMNCSPLSHTYWFQNTDWSSYNELHWLPIEVKNQSEQRSEPVLVDYNMGLYYPSILYILGIHTIHYGTPTIHFSH